MCSVIGVYSKNGGDVSQETLRLMQALEHRGPEAFGVRGSRAEKKAGALKDLAPLPQSPLMLGHCLLSTTGYSVQPITVGAVSVAHNGQIYNFDELNLHGAKLASDSQVIAEFFSAGLEKSGLAVVLKKFMRAAIGEYAVGMVYKGRLYAFRDPFGLKPLWFGENEFICAFASEPSALMKIGIEFPRPIQPGYLLEASSKGISEQKVFSVADFRKTVPKSFSRKRLREEFERAIKFQTNGLKKAAVLFSGGVDSSLVAGAVSGRIKDTRLFVAGIEGSHDIVNAKAAAQSLGLQLEKIMLDENSVHDLALRCVKILSFFDEMQVGLAVPLLACADRIREMGFKVVFSGQGSDEVFAGYSEYQKVLREKGFRGVEHEIWASLSRMWSRNFYRDDIITASNSLELRLPFLSRNFLCEAMAFPARKKIRSDSDSLRKHPVRELALSLGVPSEICSKPKKALQYGSGSQKLVSKIFR